MTILSAIHRTDSSNDMRSFVCIYPCIVWKQRMTRVVRQTFDSIWDPKCAGNNITILYTCIFSQLNKFLLWGAKMILGKQHKINRTGGSESVWEALFLCMERAFYCFGQFEKFQPFCREKNDVIATTHSNSAVFPDAPSAKEQGGRSLPCTRSKSWTRKCVPPHSFWPAPDAPFLWPRSCVPPASPKLSSVLQLPTINCTAR